MTIRSGGRARDRNQARPAEPGSYEDAWQPDYTVERVGRGARGRARSANGGYNGGWQPERRRGIPGILKFLVFALVLGGLVLAVFATVLRPLIAGAVVGWASANPAALGLPFVADLVREDLGDRLTDAPSADTTQIPFVVNDGENATAIAGRLEQDGFLQDGRAFIFIATEKSLTQKLASGTFILRKSMTPDQVVEALLNPERAQQIVRVDLRTGLRLEQITAKLLTIETLTMDPAEFYKLATKPPATLIADYEFLEEHLPDGRSLEGFLWPAAYEVLPDTTPEELIRKMLDGFQAAIGNRMDVPAARGRTFYQILSLASMVEREAVVDDERPTIAGVFENRLRKLNGFAPVLNSDPTVFYGWDTLELAKLPVPEWRSYSFWSVPEPPLNTIEFPPQLEGFQTYTRAGLIPGPICTPTLTSIDAALKPETKSGYLYFVAKGDGTNTHAFAKNEKEHNANLVKYGYR